jgi:alpha-N-arabinofuranosidase
MYKDHMGGEAVRLEFSAPSIHFPRVTLKRQLSAVGDESVPVEEKGPQADFWGLNGSASRLGKIVTITVVNPHLSEPRDTQIILRGGATATSASAQVLGGVDVHTHNTFAEPNNIVTRAADATASGSTVRSVFPPSSVVKLTIALA